MKQDGGNGGGGTADIKVAKKTLEEQQEISLENKRAQFILLKLIKILGIKPLKEKDVPLPRWLTISIDSLNYDFAEICERALDDIEIFRGEKTRK